jgi:hypothetical protein
MKLLFTPYLILCLTLFTLPAQALLSGAASDNSLLQEARVSKPDSSRVKLYLQLGEHYLYKPGELQADMDSAFAYAGQTRALIDKLGDYWMEAKSLNLLGFVNPESKYFHLAIAFHQAATNLFYPLQ